MALNPPSVDHMSLVISHALAPAFILSAVATFVSVLFARLTSIIDRVRILNGLPDEGHSHAFLKADIPRLQTRARLVNRAIFLAVISGIAATVVVIIGFGSAFLGIQHVWGVGILFIVSLAFLGAALVVFASEVRIALTEFDHH